MVEKSLFELVIVVVVVFPEFMLLTIIQVGGGEGGAGGVPASPCCLIACNISCVSALITVVSSRMATFV